MRQSIGYLELLRAMSDGDLWTTKKVQVELGADYNRALRLLDNGSRAGYVDVVETSAPRRPASYRITDKGRSRALYLPKLRVQAEHRAPRPARALRVKLVSEDPVVVALRTQPNSVFALGAVGGGQ